MPRSSRSWCETADSLMPTSVGDVADAQLAAGQRVEDPDARRVAEDAERGGDLLNDAAGRSLRRACERLSGVADERRRSSQTYEYMSSCSYDILQTRA